MEGLLDTAVPYGVGEHLLAVLAEALSNAARHAHADRVFITVKAGEDLLLRVVDNGVGIDLDDVKERRSGLRNMSDRAVALGGDCMVNRRELGGTMVEWRVPLAHGAD
jgi:signal transduction histidine kinase